MNQANMKQPVSYDTNLRICCGRLHGGWRSKSIESAVVYGSVFSSLHLHVRWARNLNELTKNKGILKQSIDNGIFTNEIIEDMTFLQNKKEKITVCDKIIELSEGSDIGNFAILCDTNFKTQRELYRQKISRASENFTKLENRTHPFYEFLCPNGESKFILIYDGNDANFENAKRKRALKSSKAQTALLDLFARGGGNY